MRLFFVEKKIGRKWSFVIQSRLKITWCPECVGLIQKIDILTKTIYI